MLKNYFKVAVRNILKHKVYSLINLTGLAVSMALCLLIYQYVATELSYDTFHENADNIYRMVPSLRDDSGEWNHFAMSPMPMGPAAAEDFPEVAAFTRITNTSETVVKVKDNCFTERIFYADPDMLSIFTFPLIHGDARTALVDQSSVVISEPAALKHFGDVDVVGRTLSIRFGSEFRDFMVSAVVAEIPDNSTITFDFVLPYEVIIERWGPPFTTSWGAMTTRTYLQLADGANPADLEAKFPDFLRQRAGRTEEELTRILLRLQPLKDVHLNPNYQNRFEPSTNPIYLFILSGIGLVLLFIACFNFTNISIGLSSVRLKEVGVRKVVGAGRVTLIRQFLTESVLLSLCALFMAIAFAELVLPVFNSLAEAHLTAGSVLNWVTVPAMLLLLLLVAALSGLYPALYLSRLSTSDILKGSMKIGGSNVFTRSLIVLQFAVSIFFIICTLYMSRQMDYVQQADLGFNNEQVLVLPISSSQGRDVIERLRNDIGSHPSIVNIAGCNETFGRESDYALTFAESEGHKIETFVFRFDEEFIPTMQIEITEGRNISKDYASDPGRAVIINEAFARELGEGTPIGKQVKLNFPGLEDNTGEVVGVVKDFHYLSLHSSIQPAIMYTAADFPISRIMVRIGADDVPGTVAMIGDTWSKVASASPFEYYFLDDDFNRQYQSDQRWGRVIIYSAVLAIFISSIGLLGVATLTLSRRTKEIGIRKVLGATVTGIVKQVNREFVTLILIGNVLAWPAAYYVTNRWMENFAYRADVGWTVYGIAAVLGVVIALTTVSVQAVRAATANPVDSLRYE